MANDEIHEHRDEAGFPTGEEVANVEGGEIGIRIFSIGTGEEQECRLEWTDYVANEWHEHLPNRTLALLRMAHLIQVVEREEELTDLDTFIAQHTGWVG